MLLGVVTFAVAAGGHPESAAHVGLACGILLLIERRNPSRAFAVALAGLAIASHAWVPVVEQALLSVRAASLATTPHAAMNPLVAWLLLSPDGFGNPSRGTWSWIYNYSVVAPTYLGLLPLALLAGARRGRDFAFAIAGGRAVPDGDVSTKVFVDDTKPFVYSLHTRQRRQNRYGRQTNPTTH